MAQSIRGLQVCLVRRWMLSCGKAVINSIPSLLSCHFMDPKQYLCALLLVAVIYLYVCSIAGSKIVSSLRWSCRR